MKIDCNPTIDEACRISYLLLKSHLAVVEGMERELLLSLLAPTPHTFVIFYCCVKQNFVSLRADKVLKTKKLNHCFIPQVKEVFEESPFLVPEDSVGIMDGSHEGML